MNPWIEAMRLRTLPVSVAGVAAGTGCAVFHHGFSLLPMLICLTFAVVAQIASNFANEYYDFRNGLDKKGREGFRRGVTEGDISPMAMRNATFGLLIADIILGCSLIYWGGWWLVPVGAAIAIFALAYSAGPYPLSHHGLGDIAVVIFFGIVPVTFTEYVQTQIWRLDSTTLFSAIGVGLLAANVLIVNNYRDYEDDKAVGKHTTVVFFGRKSMSRIYLLAAIKGLGR
ncbi:MAG: 1,4-dihydroxy-2-naphthoate octaprenyltransferase, partial [Muribaculaceae bacterium]|nr:1,4-dihydroxy-2-naphthoate octaprenyltransferase [Muribaculaceae bacterium]